MKWTSDAVAAQVREAGIIAIVRGAFPHQRLLEITDALLSAGVRIMEVTLNSPNALDSIAALQDHVGSRMLVGAGTVRTAQQGDDAIAAGADFLVSPAFEPATIALSQRRDVLHLPGVFTATEAEQAARAGCQLLKLFPADTLGPPYVRALLAPLDDLALVPTGGITVENVAAYRRAGAVAVAVGSTLVRDVAQPVAEIAARAAALRQAWEEAPGA